jgi:hypothetical protein
MSYPMLSVMSILVLRIIYKLRGVGGGWKPSSVFNTLEVTHASTSQLGTVANAHN